MMTKDDLVQEIKSDLGGDVISLAISDETIGRKIDESLRKVGAYVPKQLTESFNVFNEKVKMPDDTIVVIQLMSPRDPSPVNRTDDEFHMFNPGQLIGRPQDVTDYLTKKNEFESIGKFIELTDWYYVKDSKTLFLNYYNRPKVTVRYLARYKDVSEVTSDDVLDYIHKYALALCKIIEGEIRRKLQNAPGAMQMDGDSLVQEGKDEKMNLEEGMKRELTYMRFGIKA